MLRVLNSAKSSTTLARRLFATEGRPELFGFCKLRESSFPFPLCPVPDTINRTVEFNERLALCQTGDLEGVLPTAIRQTYGTRDEPNIVPIKGQERIVGCTCRLFEFPLLQLFIFQARPNRPRSSSTR